MNIHCDVVHLLQETEDGLNHVGQAETLCLIAVNAFHPPVSALGIVVGFLRVGYYSVGVRANEF